jgi:hypothetical protein
MPRVALLVVVACLPAGPAFAKKRRAAPQTYMQVKRGLPKAANARAAALRRFASDSKPAIGERLRAAAAWRREIQDDPAQLTKAYRLEARLHGVAGEMKNRARALRRARGAAQQAEQEGTAKLLARVVEAEPLIELLIKRTTTRERKGEARPLSSADTKLRDQVEEQLDAYQKLKDDWQHARARMWLVRLAATTTEERDKAISDLARLVRVGGNKRDLAPLRADVRRTRARLLAADGRWEEAVHESLVADRANKIPPKEPAFDKLDTRYIKSLATARLCFRAQKRRGINCADIEKKQFDALTFYDFSQESGGRAFNEARAEVVASVYTPLLYDCVKASAKSGETRNTNIQMEWAIGHDGKVDGHDLHPRRLRGGQFNTCLKEALSWFRYPPYGGEQKHQGLSFNVGE